MAETAARLSVHDQLLINLAGWLACRVHEHANRPLMEAQLRRVLPSANSDHPLMAPLVHAAAAYLKHAGDLSSMEYARAAHLMRDACLQVFMARAAQAASAIWPEENTQTPAAKEPAHAAE